MTWLQIGYISLLGRCSSSFKREALISMTCEQPCKSKALWRLSAQNNALLIKSVCSSTATSGAISFHVCTAGAAWTRGSLVHTIQNWRPIHSLFHRIIFAWEIRIITWRLLVFPHPTIPIFKCMNGNGGFIQCNLGTNVLMIILIMIMMTYVIIMSFCCLNIYDRLIRVIW